MSLEVGYHKLKDPSHWDAVKGNEFKNSMPAEKHWLGAGVYFFLEPNGLSWAGKWPFTVAPNYEGIVVSKIETENCLDLRKSEVMRSFRATVARIRSAACKGGKMYTDGTAIAFLKKAKLLSYSGIIANCDIKIKPFLQAQSKIILAPPNELPPQSDTTQIQICIEDQNIIKSKDLHDALNAI